MFDTLADLLHLLQDAASRGPLGSAILLFTLHARPLASLGAAITILALAFDPFIQQIVQYPSIPSVDPVRKSSLVRSSSFAIDATSIDWQNAIEAGIWSGAERFAQQPYCPSGNCKWLKHSSTELCSKCQNVTSYAKILDCELGEGTMPIALLNHSGSCSVDLGHGDRFPVLGSFTTHAYHSVSDGDDAGKLLYDNGSTIVREGVWSLNPRLNGDPSIPLDNGTYAGVTNPIVALGHVKVQRCSASRPGSEKELYITFAEECVLSLCAREFETSVVNGTMNKTLVTDDFGCLSKVNLEDLAYLNDTTESHCWQAGTQCAGNVTYSFCSDRTVAQTTQSSTDMGSLLQYPLLERLTGNQSTSLSASSGEPWNEDHNIFIEVTAPTSSSDTMNYITANNLGPVLAGVAASLTQQALLTNTSTIFEGTVLTTETFVAVDWPWLIYPATLVLAAIVLLILTAIHSHQCGLRIWKSSMLPLLYRTLDPDLLARQPVLHNVSTMTGVAGRAKVTLVKTSCEDVVVLTQ
jgi:hypothetical protein